MPASEVRIIEGVVVAGYGKAGERLARFHPKIENRTGLEHLVPGTLNLQMAQPYYVTPFASLERSEYGYEEVLFERCRVGGLRCLIVRPRSHEKGAAHGPAHLEIMSDRHLRTSLGLTDGASVGVEVGGNQRWWMGQGGMP
jgi:CTP-dependent riboflavin kinase